MTTGRFTPEQQAEWEKWLARRKTERPSSTGNIGVSPLSREPASFFGSKGETKEQYSARIMRIQEERFNAAVIGGCCGR